MNSRDTSRKITYSAVCTAIAIAVIIISQFTPMRIVPLIVASLAFYIAFLRCGVVYGIITTAASILICFFVSGIGTTFLFLCIVFAPYALIAFFMRKLTYKVMWQALIRLAVTAVFFALAFVAMIFLADFLVGTSLANLIDRVGAVVTAVLIVIVALPVDVFFSFGAERIIRMLK